MLDMRQTANRDSASRRRSSILGRSEDDAASTFSRKACRTCSIVGSDDCFLERDDDDDDDDDDDSTVFFCTCFK